MKKTIILFAMIAGFGAIGAHATTIVHGKMPIDKAVQPSKTTKSVSKAKPFTCTIALTGSISAGFGTISATCSATEGTCDLAQAAASSCLTSVLRALRGQLK